MRLARRRIRLAELAWIAVAMALPLMAAAVQFWPLIPRAD